MNEEKYTELSIKMNKLADTIDKPEMMNNFYLLVNSFPKFVQESSEMIDILNTVRDAEEEGDRLEIIMQVLKVVKAVTVILNDRSTMREGCN